MKKFLYFGVAHFILLAILTYREYLKDPKLYAIFLATTQNNGLHLLHTLFIMYVILILSKLILSVTLGQIRSIEVTAVNDNCFLFLTDILLVITIFNDDLCIQNLIIFTLLMALKCINWITTERIKQFISHKTYVLITITLFVSLLLSITSLSSALYRPSLCILFAFEFGVVFLSCIRNICISLSNENPNRTIYNFIIDITYIFLRLVAVTSFFLFTAMNFRIPFNLFREALSTLKMLYKKINSLVQYNRLSKELHRCEDVRSEQTCPICFVDMEVGKKISCGHIFHLDCLKTWVEGSDVCPICRREMFKNIGHVTYNTENERITGIPIMFDD
ncbi:E3 ubiquitin-protein ligase synoviolin [Conglomerata obtusa]